MEIAHSAHIKKAITQIGASLIAEADPRLPESRFVVPSLESLLFLIEEQQHQIEWLDPFQWVARTPSYPRRPGKNHGIG